METFDWHKDEILNTTVITPSYKNTQNVRRYFKSQCSENFKFNRGFMQWMKKDAIGLSMADATQEWLKRERLK